MKTEITKLQLLIVLLLSINVSFAQNVSINGNGNLADASALLDIDAVATPSLGILIPRIALQGINVAAPVSSPATSLLVYNTTTANSGTNVVSAGYYYWDGTQWVRFAYNPSGTITTAWNILGNAGTTAGTHFVGTTDAQDLVFKTANSEKMRILQSSGNVGINTVNPSSAKLYVTSTNNAYDGVSSSHTSGSVGSAFHAVRGDVTNASYTVATGYLAYHNSSNNTYAVYGTGGNYAGTFLNKLYIGNTQPTVSINVADLEVSNVVGGTNPANLTLRQSTSITAAATDMAYLNFGDNYMAAPQASIRAKRDLASSGITDLPTALTFHTINDGTAALTERMRIDNAGNVGIGTASPIFNLDVTSSTGTLSSIRVFDTGAFGGSVLLGNVNHGITRGNGTTSFSFAMIPNDVALFTTSANLFLGTGTPSVPRLTINNIGNVGIGTTTPPYKLTAISNDPTMAISAYIVNSPSLTANSATNFHGAWNTIKPNSSFNFTGDQYGAVNRIETGLAQTGSINGCFGSTNDVNHYSSATIVRARGSIDIIANIGAGNITSAYGAYCEIQNSGGGVINNGYGLYVGAIQATNKWSIYADDGLTQSYIAGNLSIGVPTTTFKFEVNGTTACASNVWTSDRRKKQNIQPYTQNALDIINQLKPVSYEWKEVLDDGMKGTQMGFIAQDLEQILPTMVVTANNEEQSKAVKYIELLPIYAKAIQELNKKLDEKTKDIEVLKKQNEEILQLLKQK